MKYVYRRQGLAEQIEWTAGFYDPNGEWIIESTHETSDLAARRVFLLNGGYKLGKDSTPVERAELAADLLNSTDNNQEALVAFVNKLNPNFIAAVVHMLEHQEARDDTGPDFDDDELDPRDDEYDTDEN